MKKINLMLVAILIISIDSAFSQKKLDAIKKSNDSIRIHINKSFYNQKLKNEGGGFIETLDLYEAGIYFNSILEKLNMNINLVSGGGNVDAKLSSRVSLRIKYGTLRINENFSNIKTENERNLSGIILGSDIGILIKKDYGFRLFILIGNDWIKIDNSKSFSEPKLNIGIKINN